MGKIVLGCIIIVVIGFYACNENETTREPGKLSFKFSHLINNQPIIYDAMQYTNAAGNAYEISEIQWFISDITLINEDGSEFLLDQGSFAHYVDTDIPDSWEWNLPDEIKPGNYTSIKMTYGIKGEKNIPYSFPNSPESDMQWPYNLGGDNGGYHYMKLNGFWINTLQERAPFNFHIGVGQEYDNDENVTGFIQNWFEMEIPNSSFTMLPGSTQNMELIMNVENWFQNPHTYDHNVYGGKIMKDQEAMGKIRDNGQDVFSIKKLASVDGENGL